MGQCFTRTIDNKVYYPPVRPLLKEFNQVMTHRSRLVVATTIMGEPIPILLIRPKNATNCSKYLVFSQGSTSDILTMFTYALYVADLCEVHVVLYDYLGYGLTTNRKPSEEKCYRSHETVVDYLQTILHIEPSQIYLIGYSLGTGVVIDYVSKNKWVNTIGLIAPYLTIGKVATTIPLPVDQFQSVHKIRLVQCQVKIFHGDKDDVISIKHGRKLYNKLVNKTLDPVWAAGIDHDDILYWIKKEHYADILFNQGKN